MWLSLHVLPAATLLAFWDAHQKYKVMMQVIYDPLACVAAVLLCKWLPYSFTYTKCWLYNDSEWQVQFHKILKKEKELLRPLKYCCWVVSEDKWLRHHMPTKTLVWFKQGTFVVCHSLPQSVFMSCFFCLKRIPKIPDELRVLNGHSALRLAWVLINVLTRKNNNPTKPAEVEVNWSVASQRQFIVVHPFKNWWQLCPMTLGHATELKMLCGSKSLIQSVVCLCPCGPGDFRMQGLLFRTEARVQPKDGGNSTGRFLLVARVCPYSLWYSRQWAFCSADINTISKTSYWGALAC